MQNNMLRYSCQINLPGFSEASQKQLQEARVLVVGAGGLGCPAAQYLAAAGIGTLGIADFDVISVGNLHRQILFTPDEVGQIKAVVACEKLQRQNPGIKLVPHVLQVSSENIMSLLQEYDLVLDCTDNFDTKYLLNDACVMSGKPLVYGAIYQFDGQVAVWNVRHTDGSFSPNYRDVFPEVDASQVPNCAEGGVIPTLAGMIGCMQANEVLKYITNTGELLAGKLLLVDAQTMQSRIIKIGHTTNTSIHSLPQKEVIPTLTVQEVMSLKSTGACVLVDVRSQAEREVYNIGGEHVPLDELKADASVFAIEKPIVVYCASGKRSGEAVKRLKVVHPDKEIYSLDGGMKTWREQV